jgi:hypothetical protein
VRVQATMGRPGASAQARWRRARAAESTTWTQTLPWRIAAILGIGAASGVLGSLVVPRLSLIIGGLAAVVAGWGLRFRPSPDAVAWRRGAAGEHRTARLLSRLERHGWMVLHDLAVPGSRATLDHLVIGPGGVFVIDSKQYRGRLRLDGLGGCGMAAIPSPLPCGRCPGRPTRPPKSYPTRSCQPACQACFAHSRRCWGPSGSPPWPTRPASASALPPDLQHVKLG